MVVVVLIAALGVSVAVALWLVWRATRDQFYMDGVNLVWERRLFGRRVLALRFNMQSIKYVTGSAMSMDRASSTGGRLGWPIFLGSPLKSTVLIIREGVLFNQILIPAENVEVVTALRQLVADRQVREAQSAGVASS